ncbi:MAG: FAD-dependent oxidoreductase [Acidobacteriota bacterium]|nr:FAD-dependent oxidoreductase [Acidobacteriota bacterium]
MIAVNRAAVVGLASAIALRERGRNDVVLLERSLRPGHGASTHNSGVVHAGLYYPEGSLKAQLCLEGRERLYRFCERHGVSHVRCGKLVVATTARDLAGLEAVASNAARCGVDIHYVDATFLRAREPHVRALAALWSPDTGWVDASAYVSALAARARAAGVHVLTASGAIDAAPRADGIEIVTPHERILADIVVNAAGTHADAVSAMLGGESFTIYPCRGEYVALSPRASALVGGLVYPVPLSAGHGLGIHLTRTLDREVFAGPTVRYQTSKDDLESSREPVSAFLAAVRELLPLVELADLRLGGSGIRAKLNGPDTPFADFRLSWDTRNHRLFHAAGIDSPGLTSSLAIGEFVAKRVLDRRIAPRRSS